MRQLLYVPLYASFVVISGQYFDYPDIIDIVPDSDNSDTSNWNEPVQVYRHQLYGDHMYHK